MEGSNKPKILIADDSEMNRAILQDMLENEYEILKRKTEKKQWQSFSKWGRRSRCFCLIS